MRSCLFRVARPVRECPGRVFVACCAIGLLAALRAHSSLASTQRRPSPLPTPSLLSPPASTLILSALSLQPTHWTHSSARSMSSSLPPRPPVAAPAASSSTSATSPSYQPPLKRQRQQPPDGPSSSISAARGGGGGEVYTLKIPGKSSLLPVRPVDFQQPTCFSLSPSPLAPSSGMTPSRADRLALLYVFTIDQPPTR